MNYTCAVCSKDFESAWSQEEARAEQVANGWADNPDENMTVVCDECYKHLAWRSAAESLKGRG